MEETDHHASLVEVGPSPTTGESVQPAKLSKLHFGVLGFMLFVNAMNVTILFSFVVFQVEAFGIAESEVGFYVGFISSSFMAGRLLSSVAWGAVSDTRGRKPVFYGGMLSAAVLSVVYGLSTSVHMAAGVRFVMGLLNGVEGIAKVSAVELSPPSAQSNGMSVVSVAWGVGLIIGPAMGGLLAEPATTAPLSDLFSEDGVFGTHPYLLPMLLNSALGFLSAFLVWRYLPETLAPREDDPTPLVLVAPHAEDRTLGRSSSTLSVQSVESSPPPPASGRRCCHSCRQFDKPVLMVVAAYAVLSVTDLMWTEVLVLWSADTEDGVAWSPSQIGTSLGAIGIITLVCISCFPAVERRLGARKTFLVCLLVQIPPTIAFPEIARSSDASTVWALVVSLGAVRSFLLEFSFVSVSLLLNNSVPEAKRGALNGVAMAAASVAKTVGPVLGGVLFAWSVSNGAGYPLDAHLAFYVLGLCLVAAWTIALLTPQSFNHRLASPRAALIQ